MFAGLPFSLKGYRTSRSDSRLTKGDPLFIGLPSRFDVIYLAKLGMASRRNARREACGIDLKEEESTFEDSIRCRLEAKHN